MLSMKLPITDAAFLHWLMFNLPTKHPGMTTYKQHVVCTGVKAHLRKNFPQAKSHDFHACLRCQMVGKKRAKQTDLCRFQGRLVETTLPTHANSLL